MQPIKKIAFYGFFLIMLLLTNIASANIVISTTRVIYPSNEQEVDVKLNNVGTDPLLVQAWLDKGDPRLKPDQVNVPFVLTPPLFRLDAKKGQTLRLMYTQEPLPKDRESVFWLNVLEIPPKPDKAVKKNWLQIAFRSRIKLFFRPEQLNKQNQVQAAPAQVTWSWQNGPKGYVLLAKNPTPYFISITTVSVAMNNKKQQSTEPKMLAPYGQQTFTFPMLSTKPMEALKVSFDSINDWGATVTTQSPISP